MSGSRTVGDVILKMECDNRRMLRSLIDIQMETAKITGNPTSTNCPNCGAPITGPFCEYCGTIFDSDYSQRISKRKHNDELCNRIMGTLESYSHKLEFTSEEVERIHAMARITNLAVSKERRLRGIYASSFF